MSRLEFEKQFERKLKNREISPSADSWEKLENKLEKNSSRKYPFWMAIAATILGGILISGLFYNQNELPEPVKVVETPSEKLFEEKMPSPIPKKVEIVQNEPKNMQKGQNLIKIQEKLSISEAFSEEEIKVAENDISESPSNETFSASEEKIIQQKIDELLAEVASKENEENAVSEAEINKLLERAALQLSLEEKPAFAESLNPDDLLFEVERELEQSFRAKIFDVLKDGFEKTRTAVANRY